MEKKNAVDGSVLGFEFTVTVSLFLSPGCGLVWLGDSDTSVKQAGQRADTVPGDNGLSLTPSPSHSSKHKDVSYVYISL